MTHALGFSIPSEFLSADEAAWWQAVDQALKGAGRERLTSHTEDGTVVEPLYQRRETAVARAGRTAGTPWDIIQRIDLPDPAAANRQILEDLQGGASGLELVSSGSAMAHGFGIRLETLGSMETLLDGVMTDLIRLRFSAGHESIAMLALLMTYLNKKGADLSSIDLSAGFDHYGWLAMRGRFRIPLEIVDARINDTLAALDEMGCPARLVEADGRIWHDGGASAGQELACAMASALAYMRTFEASGTAPDSWPSRISFTLVADADQIGTIAKARAARRLWAAVLDGCDMPLAPMRLHMQTSVRMQSRRDPWVNLLRNAVATFAAGVGGADTVTVLPHTKALGLPDSFARRLARNTQAILLEESNLYRVADPSAGSGAIEARTEAYCGAAWALLQRIEQAGGFSKAIQQGLIQTEITNTAASRRQDIARRKRPVTGVSEFPDLNEKPVSTLDGAVEDVAVIGNPQDMPTPGRGERFKAMCAALSEGVAAADVVDVPSPGTVALTVPQLDLHRDAEGFEVLRDAADATALSSGHRPAVFLACLGRLAEFTARATWTANVFAAGGLEAKGGEALDALEQVVQAFKASGTQIACLVSSDTVYDEQGADAARALKAAGAATLYLAGRPGALEDSLRQAGVDEFVYAGADILDMLQRAHAHLGLTGPDDLIARSADAEVTQ
ncbi:heterodimeric methylmalonyl-CoA mutase small subunit [Roseibium hamelinense]|uniref:Heterodimeric methylmalonyl-CoA mutase small subunit n=1 Tax=Roseibium hamelinense TaxID=150831 RepID=A0A562TK88_9HYPH|nr:methylmalonyl-CoA mutase family protein [Roseibium hamelinense]MTI42595.1 methylmalonyl-CoA mutase [Roseibium hamelinense]TWI93340.1 heterodimeric methylmalonyl-CoA mutase small subunit [Roseibium hamelinense]